MVWSSETSSDAPPLVSSEGVSGVTVTILVSLTKAGPGVTVTGWPRVSSEIYDKNRTIKTCTFLG